MSKELQIALMAVSTMDEPALTRAEIEALTVRIESAIAQCRRLQNKLAKKRTAKILPFERA